MYLHSSISWHHELVSVRSRATFLASFACAICYFGVSLKGWCCYCTCESKTERQGMLCRYEMPKHGLHFKLIFTRLKLMYSTRFLDLTVSKWHLMVDFLGRHDFWEPFSYWTLAFVNFPSILMSIQHLSWNWALLSHVLVQCLYMLFLAQLFSCFLFGFFFLPTFFCCFFFFTPTPCFPF